MKKIFFLAVLLVSILIIPVSAANVGDKMSEAVYTDIVAYVNNHPMPAYVIDGYAVIVAEDLRDYCCDVVYDEITRSLYITKAGEDATFSNKLVYKPNRETGEYYTDVLYTDIKTYVNGNEVKSFNVDGKTMIVIDEFGKYMDGYEWDSVNRAAHSYIADKPMAEFKPVTKRVEVLYEGGKAYVGNYEYNERTLTQTYTGAYDFDFDGIEEDIFIEIKDNDGIIGGMDDPQYERMSIGEFIKNFDCNGEYIHKVIVCDIDLNDGAKDLAIITSDEGDIVYNFYKYTEDLQQYQFSDSKGKKSSKIYTHVSRTYELELIDFDDETIILWRNTESEFRWPVQISYKQSGTDGMLYVQKGVAYYEIPEVYKERHAPTFNTSEYEKEMWKKGYIKAYCDYVGDGVQLFDGEYYKALYDNGSRYIFIEKMTGEKGWIYIGSKDAYRLHPYFFGYRG